MPPTVAREFAISRSSVGTRRGTTACAVARKKRFAEITSNAPEKNRTGSRTGSNSTSQTSPVFTQGATTRIRRRRHRSMNTPVNGPITE